MHSAAPKAKIPRIGVGLVPIVPMKPIEVMAKTAILFLLVMVAARSLAKYSAMVLPTSEGRSISLAHFLS